MERTSSLPGTDKLYATLWPWLTGRVFVRPMIDRAGKPLGNNGDQLMLRIFARMLEELGAEQVSEPHAADLLVIPPNGALLQQYEFPRILAEFLASHRTKPVVIFPSSALFPSFDPRSMFEGRTAPTLWILRERHSFEHLSSIWGTSLRDVGVTLAMDHDVVASGHRFVESVLPGPVSERRPLLAARWDLEATDLTKGTAPHAPTARTMRTRALRLGARVVQGALPYGQTQTAISRFARRGMAANQSRRLLERLPAEIRDDLPPADAHWRTIDASAVNLATFDEYSLWIREATAVVTDRLHVALPAAALDKQVVLVDNGYHKLRGVYEQSLADLPHVRLVSRPATP